MYIYTIGSVSVENPEKHTSVLAVCHAAVDNQKKC